MFHRRSKTRPIHCDERRKPEWPPGVPRFYPKLSEPELSDFLPEELYQSAKTFSRVMVLPFGSAQHSAREQLMGMGLSRLLIRDLMLVRNLSLRGPEDTPNDFPPDPANLPSVDFSGDAVIAGQVKMVDDERYSAELWIHHQGTTGNVKIPAGGVLSLIDGCRREAVRVLRGHVDAVVKQHWRTGRPMSFQILEEFGQLCLAKSGTMRSQRALELWRREPEFVLPLHLAGEEDGARRDLLRGLEYDPSDAQLCFLLFLMHWQSRGPQPEAVQFLRRAISLSPGHGKAHMCAPLAADPNVNMLRHSELGYRLLPGNSLAINNYILALKCAGETGTLKPLAREALQADPYDPHSYGCLIELYEAEGDYQTALGYAHRLLKLYEPTIHPRTERCLNQNPERAARLEWGWRPGNDLKETIRRLSRLAVGLSSR